MQHPMKKNTNLLCYRSDVKVREVMMTHMLLNGHLAEQTDTEIPQEQEIKKSLMQCVTGGPAAARICPFSSSAPTHTR